MIIVEDGTGLANAETLASVDFCDTHHANRGNTVWATFDQTKKEQLLRKANDYFTDTYQMSLKGNVYKTGQALAFPRDIYGATIPLPIQSGIAELALIANSTSLLPTTKRGKKRVKIGPIDVEYDGNSATAPKFLAASKKLKPYLSGFSGGVFKKLRRV